MDAMGLFWIIWMLVLPVLGFLAIVFGPVFWFFIVPKVSRMITWNRFRNVAYHLLGGDSGYAYLLATKDRLPEAVEETKEGYRFLPHAIWRGTKISDLDERDAEQLARRTYIWKDVGKPIYFGYLGEVPSVNPATLAALEEHPNNPSRAIARLTEIMAYVDAEVPKGFAEALNKKLSGLNRILHSKPITRVDPKTLREVLPQMFTADQLDAVATNRELRGMKRAGKQYTGLIVGGGILAVILILGILAIMNV